VTNTQVQRKQDHQKGKAQARRDDRVQFSDKPGQSINRKTNSANRKWKLKGRWQRKKGSRTIRSGVPCKNGKEKTIGVKKQTENMARERPNPSQGHSQEPRKVSENARRVGNDKKKPL